MKAISGSMSRPMPRTCGCGFSVTRLPSGAGSTRYRPSRRIIPVHSPSNATSRGASTRVRRTLESKVMPIAFETYR